MKDLKIDKKKLFQFSRYGQMVVITLWRSAYLQLIKVKYENGTIGKLDSHKCVIE